MTHITDEQSLGQLRVLPIHDLQSLLTFAGQSRTGKHQELIERCYAFVKSSISIQEKLDELYNHRYGPGDLATIPYPRDLITLSRTAQQQSQTSIVDVRFQSLTFNEELSLVSPAHRVLPMKPPLDMSRSFVSFYFHFTAQQASDVATSTYISGESPQLEYQKQVLLRFTLIGDAYMHSSCLQDHLPPNLNVIVNNKIVNLPQPKPTAKPNSDIIRPGRPVDITEHCRLSPMISNLVEVSWYTQDVSHPSPAYVAAVVLTERKTVPQLLARLTRPSSIRPSMETQRAIMQLLSTQHATHDVDSDVQIASTSLRLPLDCPAMRSRMRFPARAGTCEHVHCFDLEGYIRMNEKRPTWLCPVCNKSAAYADLFVDQFFLDIIAKCPPKVKAVEYDIHGQWSIVDEERSTRRRNSKMKNGSSSFNGPSSSDSDSDEERMPHKLAAPHSSTPVDQDIPVIELEDD